MRVERVHRGMWIVIGLLAGFLIGSVRSFFTGEDVAGYGNSMNGQQQFETAIVSHEPLPNGERRPLFYKLIVLNIKDPNPQLKSMEDTQKSLTPEQKKKFDAIKKPSDQSAFLREIAQAEADTRRTFAIAGVYYNGRPTQDKKGNWQKVWYDYFYIASNPYKPTRGFAITGAVPPVAPKMTDKLQALAEKLHLKNPDPPDSVLSYLNSLKAQGKIDFTYEWWKTPRITIVTWMTVCFVLIGLIWPTVVNLLAFGTFSRPYEEKADLSKVRSTSAAKKGPQGPTEADLEQLRALEAQLEANLAASGHGGPIAPADQPAPAPIKPLTAKELELTAAAKEAEERAFAAKADDFYPTEKRTKHKDEH